MLVITRSYLMAYDEELANALGMEDRDAFANMPVVSTTYLRR